jgi:hypothetical protein
MNKKAIEAIYKLSSAQQGMLFESIAGAAPGIHIEQMTCKLEGPLDREAFKRAWESVIERHAVLRTAFVWQQQADPLQVVLQTVELPLVYQDWQGLSSEDQQARLHEYLRADGQPFKLTRAPLFRLALIQLAPERYQFIWTLHHILMDGWCAPILMQEVLAYYEAFSSGVTVQLERPRPYRDPIETILPGSSARTPAAQSVSGVGPWRG